MALSANRLSPLPAG